MYLVCVCVCVCAQSCLTLGDSMDCSLPSSSAHEIFLARILDWGAISSSWGSSQPRDRTCISCFSCIGRWVLYHWTTGEAQRKGSHVYRLKNKPVTTSLTGYSITIIGRSKSFTEDNSEYRVSKINNPLLKEKKKANPDTNFCLLWSYLSSFGYAQLLDGFW